jgi:flagellar hook-associated protein 3 FlgL
MNVSTNSVDNGMIAQMQSLTNQEAQLQSQVSTGLSISAPSDAPSTYASVMAEDSQSEAINQYSSNATTALAVGQATSAALTQVKSVADSASQIGILSSGTLTASEMTAYGTQVDQLLQETVQLGNTQFNNSYLFSGTAVTTPPYAVTKDASGKITGVTYAGNASQAAIPISSTSNVTPGSDAATNQGLTNFMSSLIALRDALNSGDATAAGTAQANLLTSENTIINGVAELGAVQSRIQVSQAQQTSLSTTLGQLVSNQTSTDLPTTVVKLTQAQNAYQAAVQSAASLMQHDLLTYISVQ